MANNYFQGTEQSPYHLSVGAVLRNSKGEVACHHFVKASGYDDVYILMRETIEPGETIEGALARGLMEEFGATGILRLSLGSLVEPFMRGSTLIQKTTLYFLLDLVEIDTAKRKPDDEEKDSIIEWHDVDFLSGKMGTQAERYSQAAVDERVVLARFLKIKSQGDVIQT